MSDRPATMSWLYPSDFNRCLMRSIELQSPDRARSNARSRLVFYESMVMLVAVKKGAEDA
jgi:hypothetical protein